VGGDIVYGVVVWSEPVPFAVPSVGDDVPLPGWGQVRVRQRHMAAIVAQALTVPLGPSFVPFGLFCMTAVADLESLMGASKVMDTVRGGGGGGGGGMV
jgi:hypothetical protein